MTTANSRYIGEITRKRLVKIEMVLLAWSPTHSQKLADHELCEEGGVSLALNGLLPCEFLCDFKVPLRSLRCLLTFKVACAREIHCQFNLMLPNIHTRRGGDKSFPIHTHHVIYVFLDLCCISLSISCLHQFSRLMNAFHFSGFLYREWFLTVWK